MSNPELVKEEQRKNAFVRHWGFQAFLNLLVMRFMLSEMGRIVDETFMPVLRLLVEDKQQLLKDYRALVNARKHLPFYASPYQRWLVNYGNFVRENEFVLKKLQQHLSESDFHALVVEYTAERLAKRFQFLKNALLKVSRKKNLNDLMQTSFGRGLLPIINAMSQFLVGEMDAYIDETGVMVMEIPECAMHKSVSDTQTQDLSCLYSCKAACETVFSEKDPMCFEFEPHLPEFSCTLRVYMDGHPILDEKRKAKHKLIPVSSAA